MTGANMEKIIVGKLARLDRLPNTKNGNPMFQGVIVDMTGQTHGFRTKPNAMFNFSIERYVGAFGHWSIVGYRDFFRAVDFKMTAPPTIGEKIIFARIGG